MIVVSEVKLGRPSNPTEWSNAQQKCVKIDYRSSFVQGIKRSVFKKDPLDTVNFCEDTLDSTASHYHANYMIYLEKCWADHLGIVITPDIIWYTIISEFSLIVKQKVEDYRSLFTASSEKKKIIVPSGSLTVMPLDVLTEALKANVPSDTSIFIPEFESFTPNSRYAMLCAFCDLCSPYYDYGMLMCGFPFIDVKGSIDAWKLLKEQWNKLKVVVQNKAWIDRVDYVLDSIVSRFNEEDWWKSIFNVKRCGSGHQTELSGWFTNLFVLQPHVRYAGNFSTHVSNVKYKQLETQKCFQMSVGLFSSNFSGECMVPSFSSIIYEIPESLL